MPPKPDELSPTQIAIVVVVVLAGFVLIVTAISLLLRRRKQKGNVRFLNPQLRGGGEYDQEVVEYMKSSSLDGTTYGSSELESNTQPYELGYTTTSWHEIPRVLQPGQSNTALPEYRPVATSMSKVELEDTSRVELPPEKSDQTMRPGPLNFSRPSRDNIRLTCDTKAHQNHDHTLGKGPAGILKNADPKGADPHRVSSPTIPALLQQIIPEGKAVERTPSPVSPLTVRASVSTQGDKPRRVSFVSEVSTIQPSGAQKGSHTF
ncbi:hypothetical protein Slin15195_G034470 [Septoria linicola]|uniref:Uncharacterized protein n=1 Tax=Septoria linicola TaxID=215465 RepID=A0A9Q9AQ19_9PEZI|nr:hypothetical protein Slin15195_G034470 [Septoria linicola]